MRIQRISTAGVLAFLTILSTAGGLMRPAWGNVIVFTQEPEFLRAAPIVSTETFDEFPTPTVLGTGTVIVDGVTYTSDQPAARWIAGILIHQVPPRFVSPPNDFGTDLIGSDTLTFGAAATTNAIGFFLLTAGVFTTYNVIVTTADGAQFIDPLVGEPNPAFRGFVAPEGIASVTVTHISPLSLFNFSFDNVSRGNIVSAVPEPASATLLGFGVFSLLAYFVLHRRPKGPGTYPAVIFRCFWRPTILSIGLGADRNWPAPAIGVCRAAISSSIGVDLPIPPKTHPSLGAMAAGLADGNIQCVTA